MEKKQIKVIWRDAKLYKAGQVPKDISFMETIGFLEKETVDYLIIEKPITKNIETNKEHPPGKIPTFYFIPKKLIESRETN